MTIQKILLALLPAYFYFVPALLFPYLYKRVLKNAFFEIKGNSLDAYYEINKLEKRVSRIMDFVGFLSISVATIIALVFNKENNTYFYDDCVLFAHTNAFVGLSIITLFNNLIVQDKFMISRLNKVIEIITVFYSVILIYLFT